MTNQEKIERLATDVMGWKENASGMWYDKEGRYLAFEYWNPFVNIADAWMLVEKMEQKGWLATVRNRSASFHHLKDGLLISSTGIFQGKTAPEAITNAALKAIGVETKG